MKGRIGAVFILVLLAFVAIVSIAAAADITLSVDQQEYYFPLGQDASIPMTVTNMLGHPVDGEVSFVITEQQGSGTTMMMSSQSQAFSYTVPPGESHVKIAAGSSQAEKTVNVQTYYDYADPVSMHVSLPQITIHFMANPPSGGNPGSPVTSTSAPGGTAQASSGSSVQVIQQSFSTTMQTGSSGSGSGGQMDQDTAALKQQLRKEAARAEQEKNAFRQALERDPLLASVNASLAADGFFRDSLDANPAAGDRGSFAAEYRNAAGETVSLAGTMENGVVPSIAAESAAAMNISAPLAGNSTYQSMVRQAGSQGFSLNRTTMNITLESSISNITYQNPQGRHAFINATTSGGNVTEITFAEEREKPVDWMPLAAAVIAAALVSAAAWILYRKFRNRSLPVAKILQEHLVPREPFDHRKAALALLAEAQAAFEKQEYPDAYGKAGQALRLFLAYEHGACREMTNADLLAFLRSRNLDAQQAREILDRCSDVEFARGAPDATGFASLVAAVRETIR